MTVDARARKGEHELWFQGSEQGRSTPAKPTGTEEARKPIKGHEADVAVDGIEAVAAARDKDYDLIFMDLRMPNMDGFEATSWIREHYDNKQLRIVALTGEATRESRARCLSSEMNDFVSKPVQVRDLEEILRYTGPHRKRSVRFDGAESDDCPAIIDKTRIQRLNGKGVARVQFE